MTVDTPSLRDKIIHMSHMARKSKPALNYGILRESKGPLLRAILEDAKIGDLCELVDSDSHHKMLAQVVSLQDNEVMLFPYGSHLGLSIKTKVISTGSCLKVPLGPYLKGKILNSFGHPLDGSADLHHPHEWRPVHAEPLNPISRPLITKIFSSGIRVVDCMTTLGHGQRIGIFGEPGAGKSQLLSMIARNAEADICVIGLIGERGREIREFLDRHLPPEFRDKCITVASTSDTSPMERITAAYTATTIAEYFRDQGHSVLLLIDSITRYARALREVGLAIGEAPARRGFPPSVFSEIPKLIERSGATDKGTITAIYSVLMESDALGDPIAEEVKSLTDGHLILSAQKAQAGDYPAIDVLASKSRVMDAIITQEHKISAAHIRRLIKKYNDIELLLQVGEYETGHDHLADEAIKKYDLLQDLFRQDFMENASFASSLEMLFELAQ